MIRTKESIHGLPDGNVAYGNYNPTNGKVKFNYNDASNENDNTGFREEISREKELQSSFLRNKIELTVTSALRRSV